jgi:O-antigen ligase
MRWAATEERQSDSRPVETRSGAWSFVCSWLLGFVLVVYLGLEGGGFDVLTSGQVGIAIWWILLLGLAVGALPRRRPGPAALALIGLLAAFVVWTALSLTWSESFEKTALDLARMLTVLGVFALAILSRDRGASEHLVHALAAGIFVIAMVALLSRLHPSWFPSSGETAQFLDTARERLSYPLDYWNGLASLIGTGLPLMLVIAARAKTVVARALAAAAMPAMLLALLFTLSRGPIAATLIAIAIFFALSNDRLPQLLTLVVTGIGGAVLVVIALESHDLVHGLQTSSAHSQGNRLLLITIVVCVLAGLAEAAIALAGNRYERPAWSRVSRRRTLYAVGGVAAAIVVALIAINAPHRLSNAWDNFKQPSTHSEKGTSRLTSSGGENRYQLWSSAVREFDSEPLAGTGSGTFQFWWTRDGDEAEPIIDTHSLYFQTLGELGIVGLLLLVAFIVAGWWLGGMRVLRAGARKRPYLAAALAAASVLWITSIFDWMWKIPIVPIATLLLLAVVITAGDDERTENAALPALARVGAALLSLAMIAVIAIPLASESLVRESQSKAREGDSAAALADARSAANVEPEAATPRLQEALLLEANGELEAAQEEAEAATERESTNWRNWLVLSRIEAQRGEADAALRAYRKARSLNPASPIFAEAEKGE